MRGEKITNEFFITKQIKKPRFCSVVKHLGSVAVKQKPAATSNDQNSTKVALTGEKKIAQTCGKP